MTSHQMRALVLTAYGSPLLVHSVERPEPAEGQALVRIKASGVNPLDLKISKGQAAHARHPLPAILASPVLSRALEQVSRASDPATKSME
jgi:NADPH:quinone reductase